MQSSFREYSLFDKAANLKFCEGTFEEIVKFIINERCGNDYETFIGSEHKFINKKLDEEDDYDVEVNYYELYFFTRKDSPLYYNEYDLYFEPNPQAFYANRKAGDDLVKKRLYQRYAIMVLRQHGTPYELCRKN